MVIGLPVKPLGCSWLKKEVESELDDTGQEPGDTGSIGQKAELFVAPPIGDMLAELLEFSAIVELLTAADCCACKTDASATFRNMITTDLNST